MRTLRERLKYAAAKFGSTRIDRLDVAEIGRWRKTLPERSAVPTFETVADLVAIGEEFAPCFRPIPILVGLTGLRPKEWIALESRDIDKRAGEMHVRRVYTDGQVKLYGKQKGSLCTVPLPLRAAEALEALPPRLDTPLLFPGDLVAAADEAENDAESV